jgi:hypothetical protein
MYQWPEMADEGGLLAYGPRLIQIFREMIARQLVKVLRGAKPTDMPIEQPTRFECAFEDSEVKVIGDEPENTDYDPGPSEKAVSRGEGRRTHAAQM